MSYVFLLHFDRPVNAERPARHYLEFTSRRIEDRVNDHRSGFEYRTVPIMWAAYQRGIGFTVARVWSNATKADEKRLRDLHDNPALCPLCNPALGLRTVQYTRTSEPHEYTREIYTFRYWRTIGPKTAYGNLASIRQRPIKPARPRIRKDGTPNGTHNGIDINADPEARAAYLDEWREFDRVNNPQPPTRAELMRRAIENAPAPTLDTSALYAAAADNAQIVINGKPYDIDILNDADIAF